MEFRKFLNIGTVAFLILASLPVLAKSKTNYLTLTLGLTKEEHVANMPDSLSEDPSYNKNVVKISIAKELKTIRFEPTGPGKTNFTLRNAAGSVVTEYIIIVRKNDLGNVMNQIRDALKDIEGINFRIMNNKVVVDGEILLPRDMNRIFNVVTQFGDAASSLVVMSPLAQKKIAEMIEKDIGNPEIHVRAVNEKFLLEGVAGNEAEKIKAEIIAKTYVPDVVVEAAESAGVVKKRKIDSVINLLAVKPPAEQPPTKTIKLIVHYVELQKDYNKSFKFQWAPSLKDDSGLQFSATNSSAAGGFISTLTGTISNLLPSLNFAKAHGFARVLKSSSVIVEDGSPGVIRSITRVPYSVQNQYGQLSTAFEEAGIDTNITPRVVNAKSDRVAMTVTFSLKSLIGQTEKGPLISNNTIQTRVTVRSNQSAAIGGLVGNDSSTGFNRLPSTANSNPIFSLLASKQFQHNQSQFVVFITPVIMNSASEGSDEIKKKFRLKQ